MKIHGTVEIELKDGAGKRKYYEKDHNTVTAVGKMTFLLSGLAFGFSNTSIDGNKVRLDSNLSSDYPSNNLTNVLLNMGEESLTGKTMMSMSDERIIGRVFENTESVTTDKIGYLTPAVDNSDGSKLVTTGTKFSGSYVYGANTAGRIDTIAMLGPITALERNMRPYNVVINNIVDGLNDGIPSGMLGLAVTEEGNTNIKLLDLQTLAIIDSTVLSGTNVNSHAFTFGDYLVSWAGSNLYAKNINTGQLVYTTLSESITFVTVHDGHLYIASVDNTSIYDSSVSSYEVSITDSGIMLSPVNTSLLASDDFIDYESYPVSLSDNTLIQIIENRNVMYYVDDLFNRTPSEIFVNNYKIAGTLLRSYNNILYRQVSGNFGLSYLNIIDMNTSGNLYSYKKLSQAIDKTEDDVLTVTYYYEIQED